jgi:hypothetical protein
MPDSRVIRTVTIVVWALVAVIVLALAFVRGNTPTVASVMAAGGAKPTMEYFATDT